MYGLGQHLAYAHGTVPLTAWLQESTLVLLPQ